MALGDVSKMRATSSEVVAPCFARDKISRRLIASSGSNCFRFVRRFFFIALSLGMLREFDMAGNWINRS